MTGRGRRLAWLLAGSVALAAAVPPLAGKAELERLGSELTELLGGYRWRDARWSVLVVSLDRGDTIFALDPDSARAPASNLKLLTSAAALHELGPEFRFRTFLVSDAPVEQGVLSGDLVLYGTGDPGISDRFYPDEKTVFRTLADQLLARGIHTVAGDLVGDASYLPGPLRPESWDPRDLNDHFAPAISALSFNENVVSLRVEAAPRVGHPPLVHTLPDHAGLEIDNRAETVAGAGRVFIGRDDPMEPIVVEGRIPRGGRDVWRQMTVPDPAAFTVSVFRSVLEERGITVLGGERIVRDPSTSLVGGRRVTAPAHAGSRPVRILAEHVSLPLRDYLAVVNKKSNNLFAELVFRTLGRVTEGTGDAEAASRSVRRSLATLGVGTHDVMQLDGSGLSPLNRVRASTFVQLLSRLSETDLWSEFWYSLPEAGNRRELGRMYRTAAAGNLRAKTGTIEGVSALTGLVQSADGERLAFSIMVNGARSTSSAKRVENGIGVRLASFTRGPDAPTVTLAQLPPPPIPADAGGMTRHQVARGESFDAIARRYGVSLEDLLRANPTIEPRRLRAGAWIQVPPATGEGGPASAAGAAGAAPGG